MGIVIAILGLCLGGLLKGATGAGAPIIAVPILAMYFDVPLAVTIFVMPNLLTNLWQSWTYREHQLPPRFVILFAGGGGIGAGIGTVLLANLPAAALTTTVASTLILIGAPLDIAIAVVTAVIGVWLISAGLAGYFMGRLGPIMRFLFGVFGLLALIPAGAFAGALWSDVIGVAGGLAVMATDLLRNRHAPVKEPAS